MLKWPSVIDTYTISFRLIDDVVNCAEYYGGLMYKKLVRNGFYDIEGQFDVTEEMCLALNNLQVSWLKKTKSNYKQVLI